MMRFLILMTLCLFISVPANSADKSLPEWSVLVYMYGQDRTTYNNARKNAAALEQIGSTEKVNLLLELGLAKDHGNYSHYDSDPRIVRRYLLKNSDSGSEANSDGLKSAPEYENSDVDMYLMEDLGAFIKWAKEKHPARHYMLMLWSSYVNHPLRCMNTCYAYREDIPAMAVAREIKSAGGVDVLAIDSGGLQSADWLYELQGTAKYAVGTEGDNVVYGYSYSQLFSNLNSGGITPLKAAEFVAYAYADNSDKENNGRNDDFSSFSSTQGYSQSVVDMGQINALKKKTEAFAKAVMSNSSKEDALGTLEKSLYFKDSRPNRYGFSPITVDIYDFAVETEKSLKDKKVLSAASSLKKQINKTVMLNLKKDSESMWGDNNVPFSRSGGISVSLPRVPRRYYGHFIWNKPGVTWYNFRKWIYSIENSEAGSGRHSYASDSCTSNTVTGTPGYYSCGKNKGKMDKIYGITGE